MKRDAPHILCVNPWIHDFAAFDFWAKPLGLLSIAAVLREQGFAVSYIDCQDRFHPNEPGNIKVQEDGRGPFRKTPIELPKGLETVNRTFSRYGILPEWFDGDLKALEKPDLVFVTSQMTYWASGVAETIDRIKAVFPDVPLVLGGIYAGLNFEHACTATRADLVIKGPAESRLHEIILKYTGIELASDCLSKELDDMPRPALDLVRRLTYIPILTSRGCPFSCEYCASSYLEPTLRRRSAENVFEEIAYWHKTYGVKNVAFYDDALLIDGEKYAFVLFEKLIRSGMDLQFHTPNALHVRQVTKKAAELMFRSGFKTIRLGLETTEFSDSRTLDVKVKGNEFTAAMGHLQSAGFKREQIGAYLLCGLPGQDLDEVEKSMHFVHKAGAVPVLAFYTPIPHTPMWEEAVQNSKYDLLQHPVFTNNTLFPCVSASSDLARISQLKNLKF